MNFIVFAAKFQTEEGRYNIPWFFLLQSETYSIYAIPRHVCVWDMYSNYLSCFVLGFKLKSMSKWVNDLFVLILIERLYLVFLSQKFESSLFCHNLCLQKSVANAWNTKRMMFSFIFWLYILYVIILYIKFSSWINQLIIKINIITKSLSL